MRHGTLKALAALALSLAFLPAQAQGKREAVIALSGNPDTLDPQKTTGTLTFQVLKSVYDTLLEPAADGTLLPALATKWTVSPDGRKVTFTLRKGVTFHNGDSFGAADVKATLERIKAPATASPSAQEFAVIGSISTPDDSTVVLDLSEPSAPLLSTLASGWSAILPAKLVASGHDFASRPVGTGPFAFKEWKRDEKISLVKNGSYWQKGVPALDAASFPVVTERAVAIQGLLSGSIDFVDELGNADIALLSKDKRVNLHRYSSSLVLVVAINCSSGSLADPRVRQALTLAVDKRKVLDAAYAGGTIVGTFCDPGDPFYADFASLYPYDQARAKKLLKEAGFDFGKTLDLVLPQNYDPHVKAGQIYQQEFEAIGVKTKIRLVDWPTWISDVYGKARYDLTVIGHTGKVDPDGRLIGYGTMGPYVRWENAEVARLVDEGRRTMDFAKRKAIYQRIEEIMAREAPFIFLGSPTVTYATGASLSGFAKTPKLDSYDLRAASKK